MFWKAIARSETELVLRRFLKSRSLEWVVNPPQKNASRAARNVERSQDGGRWRVEGSTWELYQTAAGPAMRFLAYRSCLDAVSYRPGLPLKKL